MAETLKEKTARGLLWGGLNSGLQQLLGLLFGIVLGRLLSPDDYGMIAMIAIFSLVANELQNSGFKVALANLREPRAEDYNSVFWTNIAIGAVLYVVLFAAAPLIAAYYHEPRLTPLARYAFLGFVFASFGTAQSAYLFKNLRAKQQAKAAMTATVLSSSVGVAMAALGYSYWSLATQTNLYILLCTLLYWYYSDWRPTLKIDLGPARRMFRFSCKLLASSIVTDVNNNILNILLGRFYTAHDAGNYNQAWQWNYKASYLVQGMMAQVAQPVLVDVRDERERQLRVLRKMMRFAAFVAFPLLFGFALVAQEFIVVAIGAKWLESARLLQVLCVGGAFAPLSVVLYNMLLSRGKSSTYMWANIALCVCQLVLMTLLRPYGIRVMVVAFTAVGVAWFFVWWACVRPLVGYRLSMLLADVLPFALAAGGVMLFTGWATASIPQLWLLLLVRVALAAVLYIGIMWLARVQILKECLRFLNKKH